MDKPGIINKVKAKKSYHYENVWISIGNCAIIAFHYDAVFACRLSALEYQAVLFIDVFSSVDIFSNETNLYWLATNPWQLSGMI